MHLTQALPLVSFFFTLGHTQVTVVNTIITYTGFINPGHTAAGVTNNVLTIQPLTIAGETISPVTLSGKATIGYGVTVIAQSSKVYVFGKGGAVDIQSGDGTVEINSATVIDGTLIAPNGATATTTTIGGAATGGSNGSTSSAGSSGSAVSGGSSGSASSGGSSGGSSGSASNTASAASASKTSDSGSVKNFAGVGVLGLAVAGALGAVGF